MSRERTDPQDDLLQRQRALARWDNEGGAGVGGPQVDSSLPDDRMPVGPALTNSELMALHSRIIALENLVTSLLATASDHQLQLVRDMAAYITPRPGFTRHPLMIHAAAHMIHLVERAAPLRSGETS